MFGMNKNNDKNKNTPKKTTVSTAQNASEDTLSQEDQTTMSKHNTAAAEQKKNSRPLQPTPPIRGGDQKTTGFGARNGFTQPPKQDEPQAKPATAERRKLIVGPEIHLSGEISACDIMIVEGFVEAKVRDGKRLELAECGTFKGDVEIDEAEIAGTFEGHLAVKNRLFIRSNGRVIGEVEYGELEIETGGKIDGEIHSQTRQDKAASNVTPIAPATSPAADTLSENGSDQNNTPEKSK